MKTWSVRAVVGVTALASALITAVVAFSPVKFAYTAPDVRILLETVQAMIAGLVAFLLVGRFRRTHARTDALVLYSLTLLGVTNLFFALLPAISDDHGPLISRFSTWAPLTIRTIASAGFMAAALLGSRLARLRFGALSACAAAILTALVIGVVAALAARHLPAGVLATATDSSRPDLDAHAAVTVSQLVVAVFDCGAAIGFTRRASREGDFLFGALAVGMVLVAISRVNFFLYPSLYSEVVHVGDFFRLGAYIVLLVGAGGEIQRFWSAQAELAVLRERRRLARDLHDGLAQELSFIRSQLSSMATGDVRTEMLPHVADAADRAYLEARDLLDLVTRGTEHALEEQLEAAVRPLAQREGVDVVVTGRAPDVPPEVRVELVRIACEATTNAVRHARPDTVTVVLDATGPAVLSVRDDGRGFDPNAVDGRGYGLQTMRARARAIGAELHVRSTLDAGTTVEVCWS